MASITCKYCGGTVSDWAIDCKHCGEEYFTAGNEDPSNGPSNAGIYLVIFWIIVLIVVAKSFPTFT
jgi:hypothetical protein